MVEGLINMSLTYVTQLHKHMQRGNVLEEVLTEYVDNAPK